MTQTGVIGFAVVSFAIVIVPGPSVLFAISRALAGGRRHALLTVFGNATGLFLQVMLVALGLGVVAAGSDAIYSVLKLAGAAYLVWLGTLAIRRRQASAVLLSSGDAQRSTVSFGDGFMVGVSNPKSLAFLAALLPQYAEPAAGAAAPQMLFLGAIFCLIAVVGDTAWVLVAARARPWLSSHQGGLSGASITGGLVMIGLGLVLAASSR